MKRLLALAALLFALPAGAQVFIPSGGWYTINQGLGNAAGATVSSVGLTGDGVVIAASVTGSPVVASSGMTLALVNACANCLLVNKTGSPAAPAYSSAPVTVSIQLAGGAEPTCNAAARGKLWYVPGASLTADKMEVCAKSSSDVYAWRSMATIP